MLVRITPLFGFYPPIVGLLMLRLPSKHNLQPSMAGVLHGNVVLSWPAICLGSSIQRFKAFADLSMQEKPFTFTQMIINMLTEEGMSKTVKV